MKHQCKDCGSTQIYADRQLGGRLVCSKCGSFKIGWHNRSTRKKSNIIKPFRNNSINPIDYQYIAIACALIVIWIASDSLGLINKNDWMSWSGMMIYQPHRFFTSALVHMDGRHLLMNLGGIVVARAIFMQLGMRSKYLFALLVATLMPLSSVVYGIDAFLLLAAIKGKDKFLKMPIYLAKNYQAQQTMIVLTALGQVWNFMGGVSVVGHQSGLVAGLLLFFI